MRMSPDQIEAVGIAAGTLTTLCWLPQAFRILKSRSAEDLSLVTQSAFTVGILLWLVYGIVLGSPALIASNGVTLALSTSILVLKLRFG
jgi:MtN3 and saliva related transmembrane protein